MSFPSVSTSTSTSTSTFASSSSKLTHQKPTKNKKHSRANNPTGTHQNQYTLPGPETSGLDFEIFEDPRCAICDADLPPIEGPHTPLLPQLCASCHLQVTQLKNERAKILRQQREKQLREMHEALEAVSAQAELRRVLMDGNERLRAEIEEIGRERGEIEEVGREEREERREERETGREG
ncbi:uncharacterized protein EAF01_010622 [Botrytis porri]|uniref:Uncharacterized protein n=1 Tax=Botrytis porri TaxID=87229 RepID=A0A4Z1KUW1_9HELO|nr:uncharacterized protein EAF01_010622 [Botrytis porri]KAF7890813.1 hypothetical protein EAF01_010622 [Botrytis porri]TGO88319.1 hypothetical protein BPOR_0170g00110 [Botrytis porri]